MSDLTALSDVAHFWGGDLRLSPTGDLAKVRSDERSRQRVLRRLLTNPGDYLFHPDYGAGLPRLVGTEIDADEVTALIREQMALEPSVSQDPEPLIVVTPIPNGVAVRVNYVSLPDRQPVPLSFDVSV